MGVCYLLVCFFLFLRASAVFAAGPLEIVTRAAVEDFTLAIGSSGGSCRSWGGGGVSGCVLFHWGPFDSGLVGQFCVCVWVINSYRVMGSISSPCWPVVGGPVALVSVLLVWGGS
jgi:hypothetical protein